MAANRINIDNCQQAAFGRPSKKVKGKSLSDDTTEDKPSLEDRAADALVGLLERPVAERIEGVLAVRGEWSGEPVPQSVLDLIFEVLGADAKVPTMADVEAGVRDLDPDGDLPWGQFRHAIRSGKGVGLDTRNAICWFLVHTERGRAVLDEALVKLTEAGNLPTSVRSAVLATLTLGDIPAALLQAAAELGEVRTAVIRTLKPGEIPADAWKAGARAGLIPGDVLDAHPVRWAQVSAALRSNTLPSDAVTALTPILVHLVEKLLTPETAKELFLPVMAKIRWDRAKTLAAQALARLANHIAWSTLDPAVRTDIATAVLAVVDWNKVPADVRDGVAEKLAPPKGDTMDVTAEITPEVALQLLPRVIEALNWDEVPADTLVDILKAVSWQEVPATTLFDTALAVLAVVKWSMVPEALQRQLATSWVRMAGSMDWNLVEADTRLGVAERLVPHLDWSAMDEGIVSSMLGKVTWSSVPVDVAVKIVTTLPPTALVEGITSRYNGGEGDDLPDDAADAIVDVLLTNAILRDEWLALIEKGQVPEEVLTKLGLVPGKTGLDAILAGLPATLIEHLRPRVEKMVAESLDEVARAATAARDRLTMEGDARSNG